MLIISVWFQVLLASANFDQVKSFKKMKIYFSYNIFQRKNYLSGIRENKIKISL